MATYYQSFSGMKAIRPNRNPVVLVVEDEESNLIYLRELLSEMECEVLQAKNGAEAVEICKKNPGIEVALIDLKMPVMNGFETQIKLAKIAPEIRLVAQTAYAMSADKKKVLDAGFVDYLPKPIMDTELEKVMDKWLG